jgi:chromosome segregation ATPase
MRQNLKPKDEQIDDLKDQLANLEEVLEKEMSKLTKLGETVNKQRSKI